MTLEHRYLFGVEEELQILDDGGALSSSVDDLLPELTTSLGQQIAVELYQSQIEIGTAICASLDEARAELTRLRGTVSKVAARTGHRIAAAGTHPFSHWRDQRMTPKRRYQNLREDNRSLVDEEIVFGCHVHVGLPSREAAVRTMSRARVWLPVLLALTANSPFWVGADTGYASFRAELWRRWPASGIPPRFESAAAYEAGIAALVGAGAIREATKLYWDARPSQRYETLEFRIADVQTTVEEAVTLAGLVRALARTCHEQALRDEPPLDASPELLGAARWLAARDGLGGRLLDPETLQPSPAPVVVRKLLDLVRPALELHGDLGSVSERVGRALAEGGGAARQRAAFARAGRVEDVVERLVEETVPA